MNSCVLSIKNASAVHLKLQRRNFPWYHSVCCRFPAASLCCLSTAAPVTGRKRPNLLAVRSPWNRFQQEALGWYLRKTLCHLAPYDGSLLSSFCSGCVPFIAFFWIIFLIVYILPWFRASSRFILHIIYKSTLPYFVDFHMSSDCPSNSPRTHAFNGSYHLCIWSYNFWTSSGKLSGIILRTRFSFPSCRACS